MIRLSAQGWWSQKEKLGQGPILGPPELIWSFYGTLTPVHSLVLVSELGVCVETPASQLLHTSPIPPSCTLSGQ